MALKAPAHNDARQASFFMSEPSDELRNTRCAAEPLRRVTTGHQVAAGQARNKWSEYRVTFRHERGPAPRACGGWLLLPPHVGANARRGRRPPRRRGLRLGRRLWRRRHGVAPELPTKPWSMGSFSTRPLPLARPRGSDSAIQGPDFIEKCSEKNRAARPAARTAKLPAAMTLCGSSRKPEHEALPDAQVLMPGTWVPGAKPNRMVKAPPASSRQSTLIWTPEAISIHGRLATCAHGPHRGDGAHRTGPVRRSRWRQLQAPHSGETLKGDLAHRRARRQLGADLSRVDAGQGLEVADGLATACGGLQRGLPARARLSTDGGRP